jgi:hypothetical protein
LDRQLAFEHAGAGVVDAQSADAVVVQRVQVHELAVTVFFERIMPQPQLGVLKRSRIVAVLFEKPDGGIKSPSV